ncbi:MAG TPA: hypothetical protein VN132_16450 [Bdellovibrio sp.]|nr:hypothetical protein [Bdellovibrio sp.]
MKSIVKSVTTAILLSSTLAQAQNVCAPQAKVTIKPIIVSQSPSKYSDILSRCSNYVSDIKRAMAKAGYLARSGHLEQASNVLLQALAAKVRTNIGVAAEEAPHTLAAIQGAYQIAVAAFQSTANEQGRLGGSLVGQVRYTTMSELVKLVVRAYEELDAPYYVDAYSTCQFGRCEDAYEELLPREYFMGIVKLAHQFLLMEKYMAPMQANDRVEIAISGAVVKASKNILLGSLFRRSYACTITDLHNLEIEINEQLNCGGYMPDFRFVDYIRQAIAEASRDTRTCR